MIFRSFIRSIRAGRAPDSTHAPLQKSVRVAMPDQNDWCIKPRYNIDKVCSYKQLDDPARPLRFAELDLDGSIVRYCVSSPTSEWRVKTLFTKEPGTIDWIHSFNPGETFVDVGANVGMYSVYAGAVARARVFAFEPESQNYAELCRSIYFNERARKDMVAWCAAIGAQDVEISRLLVREMHTGYSFHDFGEPSRDYAPEERFAQGSVAFSLDHLVASGVIPEPDHVKIDVDGHENKVVQGMQRLLERRTMRTVLLEADSALPETRGLIRQLLAYGWVVSPDQLRFTRSGLRPTETVMAELEAGAYTGNIIFGRRPQDLAFATDALRRYSASELESMALPA